MQVMRITPGVGVDKMKFRGLRDYLGFVQALEYRAGRGDVPHLGQVLKVEKTIHLDGRPPRVVASTVLRVVDTYVNGEPPESIFTKKPKESEGVEVRYNFDGRWLVIGDVVFQPTFEG